MKKLHCFHWNTALSFSCWYYMVNKLLSWSCSVCISHCFGGSRVLQISCNPVVLTNQWEINLTQFFFQKLPHKRKVNPEIVKFVGYTHCALLKQCLIYGVIMESKRDGRLYTKKKNCTYVKTLHCEITNRYEKECCSRR